MSSVPVTWVTTAEHLMASKGRVPVKTVCFVIGKERKVIAPGVQVPIRVTVNEEQRMKV